MCTGGGLSSFNTAASPPIHLTRYVHITMTRMYPRVFEYPTEFVPEAPIPSG